MVLNNNNKKIGVIISCIIIILVSIYFYKELPEILVNTVNLDSITPPKESDLLDKETPVIEDEVVTEASLIDSEKPLESLLIEEPVLPIESFNFDDPAYSTLHYLMELKHLPSSGKVIMAPEYVWNHVQSVNTSTGEVGRQRFIEVLEGIAKGQDLNAVDRVQLYSTSFQLAELKYSQTGTWMAPSPAEYFRVMVRDIPESALSVDKRFEIYKALLESTVVNDPGVEPVLDQEWIGYAFIGLVVIGNFVYHVFG